MKAMKNVHGCAWHARIQRGDGQGIQRPPPPPLEHRKNIGFLSNTGPDPLRYHKATKTAFNVGPILARQRNAIKIAFRWWADDGPILLVFGSTHQIKTPVKVGPPLKKLSGSAHAW